MFHTIGKSKQSVTANGREKTLMKLNSCFENECVIVFHVKIITASRVSVDMCFR